MRLNISSEATLNSLLGNELFTVYRHYKNGNNLIGYGQDTDSNTDNNIPQITEDIVNNTYPLLAFKILRLAIEYTPVDTGKLRSSSYLKPYGTGFVVGYDCEYAVHVHEVGDNKHKFPTQYKFLEDAAMEVLEEYYNDTGNIINITIEYNPLRVFIGVDNPPGQKLANIKIKEAINKTQATYNRLLNNFHNWDPDTASEADNEYYNKMSEFFDYYTYKRHRSEQHIIELWVDRLRHK